MRLSVRSAVMLLVACALGVLGGAALIGVWALGLAIIADSVAVAVFVLRCDDGVPEPLPGEVPQPNAWAVSGRVSSILERARAS